jgi:hypothetical protein
VPAMQQVEAAARGDQPPTRPANPISQLERVRSFAPTAGPREKRTPNGSGQGGSRAGMDVGGRRADRRPDRRVSICSGCQGFGRCSCEGIPGPARVRPQQGSPIKHRNGRGGS